MNTQLTQTKPSSRKILDPHMELQNKRLRAKKQVHWLNVAVSLAGCAFLVTTVGCVARIAESHEQIVTFKEAVQELVEHAEDVRNNTPVLSDISTNSSDTNHTHQVPGSLPERLETVSMVMTDEAAPAEEAVRQPASTLADTVTFRKDLSSANAIPETGIQGPPHDVLADLVRLGGPLPVNSGSENTVSDGLSPVRPGTRRDTAFAEISHGQNDKSTFVKSSYNVGKLFSLGAAFTEQNRDDEFDSLSDKNKGFWRVKMNSSLLGTGLDAEIALSSFDTESSKDFWMSEHRMLNLGSQTTWQGFNVGARYQSVGKDFENTADLLKSGHKKKKDKLEQDTQGPELWSYRQFGNLGVKAYTSLYNNNLAGDRTLPRFTRQKVGSSVNYLISSWPEVGVVLDYATGTLESSDEPAGFNSVSQDVRDLKSSIYYTGDLWSGSLSVENATGNASGTNVTDMQMFYAEASYLPIDTVSISPSISYIRENYPEFDLDSDTMSSSLTFAYKPKHGGLNYTLYGEYSTEENTDWEVDNSYLYTSLGVNWDSKKPQSLIKQWSVELFYDQYVDNIYSDSNTGGLGFMLKLRSSPMPARRFENDLR